MKNRKARTHYKFQNSASLQAYSLSDDSSSEYSIEQNLELRKDPPVKSWRRLPF